MVIVLLGPPGAGKGTQCKRIMEKYRLVHLSSGDILRSERAAGTELGKKTQKYMDSGKLVPDQIIIKMMVDAMARAGGDCVLDGFPRTLVQAVELDGELAQKGKKIDAVVNLVIDDKIVENRITGRRSCPVCGAVYHIDTLKPRVEGFCDKCEGQKLVQRPDDKPEIIKQRLETYHEQTAAVIGYYVGKGYHRQSAAGAGRYAGREREIFDIDVDADRPIDDVTARIFEKLDSFSTAAK